MQPPSGDDLMWTVRAFIYDYLAAYERPPTIADTASALAIPSEAARGAYAWLHEHHAIFLDADGQAIRMAHPFSGVPTDFRVFAGGRAYWANCAWDMLGIPAALGRDARIEARYADTGEPARLQIESGRVRGEGQEVVYFRIPFSRWYDDLVFT
jgi:hypothetical protein